MLGIKGEQAQKLYETKLKNTSGQTQKAVEYIAAITGASPKEALRKYLRKERNVNNLQRRLITHEDPKSPISEAYRSLRTSLMYSKSNSSEEAGIIAISSVGPGEGKTTTIANAAITYANLGKKTLLIDTDLRRPVEHKVFTLDRDPGVTNFLSGQESKIDKP